MSTGNGPGLGLTTDTPTTEAPDAEGEPGSAESILPLDNPYADLLHAGLTAAYTDSQADPASVDPEGDASACSEEGDVDAEELVYLANQAPRRPKIDRERAMLTHAAAMARGARCPDCPLFGCRRGPVLAEIRPGAALLTVAEAPGKNEVADGRPLVGWSGEEYMLALNRATMNREDTSITNAILCQPPPPESLDYYLGRLPPTVTSPLVACWPRLVRDIREARAKNVLAMGEKALISMARYFHAPYAPDEVESGVAFVGSIAKQHGAPVTFEAGRPLFDGVELDRRTVLCSSYHPAFAARAREWIRVVRSEITRAALITLHGIQWRDPPILVFASTPPEEAITRLEALANFAVEKAGESWVALDIETDGIEPEYCQIRCIGFHVYDERGRVPEVAFVVPVRYKDGRPYWPTPDLVARANALVLRIIRQCRLVMHNGGPFDSRVLEQQGLWPDPDKLWYDTRLAHKATFDCDIPHDLDTVATRFFDCPKWKHEADHKASRGVKYDIDLHVYCAKDVAITGRLRPFLHREMVRAGGLKQFVADAKYDVIYRKMSQVGLPLDERVRGKFSEEYGVLCDRLRRGFQVVVQKSLPDHYGFDPKGKTSKKPINPGSSQQLAKWLFEYQGYTPTLTPEGKPWSEGQPVSTKYEALVLLEQKQLNERLKHGDEQAKATQKALDYLLRFKAADKVRGTFIDGLRPHPFPGLSNEVLPEVAYEVGPENDRKRVVSLPERAALQVLYSNFLLGPPSGRLASQHPNFQNIPAAAYGGVNCRLMFVSPPGHKFVGADFRQLELRMYAVLAGDKMLIQAFREGLDAHSWNTATLTAADLSMEAIRAEYNRIEALPPKDRKEIRNVGKVVNFAETYGIEDVKLGTFLMTVRKKSTGERTFPDMTEERAMLLHERYHKLRPETRIWHAAIARQVAREGFVETLFLGRRRWFPYGASKQNAPPNHQDQGSAADIVNRAAEAIAEKIPHRKWSRWTGLCLQVHDQLVVCVPDERAEYAKSVLESVMPYEYGGVRFEVDEVLITDSIGKQ